MRKNLGHPFGRAAYDSIYHRNQSLNPAYSLYQQNLASQKQPKNASLKPRKIIPDPFAIIHSKFADDYSEGQYSRSRCQISNFAWDSPSRITKFQENYQRYV